ncbi:MAG: hypothetical protein ACREAA_08655 [Candidatus Polarisedimenticolia bacterium]
MMHTALLALLLALAAEAGTPAELLFAKLRSLEGEWNGASTRGWTDRVTFRSIAEGSVIVSTSFEAHPGETMMTMYHMDGSRLILTHYCVAKNQPRLVATSISADGRRADFTFLDATGIPTRDAGHMDRAVFEFQDDDHFSSKWTWYQNGEERWMEEIKYTRAR